VFDSGHTIWSELVFDSGHTIVAKGAQGYIKPASISRGAQVYISKHKEYKGHILQEGCAKDKEFHWLA
jgi:hypothetical protein